MAHAVKIGGLTDELVTLLTSTSAKSNPAKFSIHRESALRILRSTHYPRTDQFDVQNRFDGLEEKLRVYNEDPLADALRQRLDRLAKIDARWTPEILHLLLELAGKPISNARLEELDFLKPPEEERGPPLTWKDLAADDPLMHEKSVWKNVDFGAASSDDDEFEERFSNQSVSTEETTQSSLSDEYHRPPDQVEVDAADKTILDNLQKAQFWKRRPTVNGVRLETVKKPITELQAIREVLFMLAGLPTFLFESSAEKLEFLPSRSYTMKHASSDAFQALIEDLAELGSSVMMLRVWSKRQQTIPLFQAFQDAVVDRISAFDSYLSDIQGRFIAPRDDVLVSLISVKVEVELFLRPLTRLFSVVRRLEAAPYAHAFYYLEMLYDETCKSQMAGDDKIYIFMGTVLFECLRVYLRSIRTWMEDGQLGTDDKVFFVAEASKTVEPACIWDSKYQIRRTQAGVLHAPKFLQTAAHRIFTTGKSVVVLKLIGHFSSVRATAEMPEPSLDFDTVCKRPNMELVSFPELFDIAFNDWIQTKHHFASSRLQRALLDKCGLQSAIDAVSRIYFMMDGSVSSTFTAAVFDKLDTLDNSWNDRFTLTELAQGTLGSMPGVSSDNIRMAVLSLPRKYQDVARCRRSVKVLAILQVKYLTAWPVQIIQVPSSIPSYRSIFTFLFQIRRTTHILTRERLVKDTLDATNSTDERALYYALRSRLLWFSQTLYHYLTWLVVEPRTREMQEKLVCAEDIDAMIAVHNGYIKSVKDQALLGSRLEPIHKAIIKLLDLGIKLEDAQASNAVASKATAEEQQDLMDMSLASLGLHRHESQPAKFKRSVNRPAEDSDDEEEVDVDLSILSSVYEGAETEVPYVEQLHKMKADLDRSVRFVTSGLRGVARAGAGEDGRSWDTLAEMLESGLETGVTSYL